MPKVGQEQKISARPLLTHIGRLIVAVPEFFRKQTSSSTGVGLHQNREC